MTYDGHLDQGVDSTVVYLMVPTTSTLPICHRGRCEEWLSSPAYLNTFVYEVVRSSCRLIFHRTVFASSSAISTHVNLLLVVVRNTTKFQRNESCIRLKRASSFPVRRNASPVSPGLYGLGARQYATVRSASLCHLHNNCYSQM